MADLVRFQFAGEREIIVETDSVDEGLVPVGRAADGVVKAAACFSDRLDAIRDAVTEALATLREGLKPDVTRVSFGIRFTAEAGAVIAKTSLEGNLGVEMVWQRPEQA
jgi:hypothetical protein